MTVCSRWPFCCRSVQRRNSLFSCGDRRPRSARVKLMARLFIAVWPSAEIVEDLRGLPRKDRLGIRWVKPENWHITLRFMGEADPDEVADRLDGMSFDVMKVRFGPGIDVLQERAIILPAHGLDRVVAAVAKATSDIGSDPPRKRFSGHMTLARMKQPPSIPDVIGARFVAVQFVTEIALVASKLRPDGAVYETLETFDARVV